MVNHTEVAKLFANGSNDVKGKHFYVSEGILWSYGTWFPVAKWLDYPKMVLWNKSRYSNSTSKHQSHAMYEISKAHTGVEFVQVSTSEFKSVISQVYQGQKVCFITRDVDPAKLTFEKVEDILYNFLKANGLKFVAKRYAKDAVQGWRQKSLLKQI